MQTGINSAQVLNTAAFEKKGMSGVAMSSGA
jgi:hypothetical protein